MNILITGAFGFVGTNLSNFLSTPFNSQLFALDVFEPVKHGYSKYYSWNDLKNINGKDVDAIIHLAGKAHDTKNITEEKAYFDINVGLTEKIFEFFLQSNASRFIFFSSVKAVADSVEGDFLTEDDEAEPGTAYGRSKLEAERYVGSRLEEWEREGATKRGEEEATERGSDGETERGGDLEMERLSEEATGQKEKDRLDKKIYILRPCMIHGPGNKGNLNLLYKLVSKGIPWPLGAFENRRSFASVDNLAYVVKEILEKVIEPGTYNIADDEPLSTNRIIELIADSKAKRAKIWNINPGIISLAAWAGDKLHLPLNTERLKKLTESYVVSNSKIKKALGVERMPVTGEEGMRRTLGAF